MIEEVTVLSGLGLAFATALVIASRKLAVQTDERIGRVRGLLPGSNCGACGFAGCDDYASTLVRDSSHIQACRQISGMERRDIGRLLGIEVVEVEPPVAKIMCGGGSRVSFKYLGAEECALAAGLMGGHLECKYGCLGFGDCARACVFEAIEMGADGLPLIDEHKCRGCGLCVKACPKGIIKLIPRDKIIVFLLCSSTKPAKIKAAACKNSCVACGLCVKACPIGAVKVENNLAVINHDFCTRCGECVKACRRNCLKILPELLISAPVPRVAAASA